jgi:hypothetical protein
MTSAIDRAAASRALAKAIAYHQAGKAAMAREWAQRGRTNIRVTRGHLDHLSGNRVIISSSKRP